MTDCSLDFYEHHIRGSSAANRTRWISDDPRLRKYGDGVSTQKPNIGHDREPRSDSIGAQWYR